MILLVDNLINKNLEKSTLNLEKIESLIDPDDRYHIILSKVLKNYLEVFKNNNIESTDDKFLKIVKNITSKGFVRSNYEEKLVDLSDVRINLKSKN